MAMLEKLGLIERKLENEAYYMNHYESLKKMEFDAVCAYYIGYKKIGDLLERELLHKKIIKVPYLRDGQTRVKDTIDVRLINLRFKEVPEDEDLLPKGFSPFWNGVIEDFRDELTNAHYSVGTLLESYAVLERTLFIMDLVLYNKNSPHFVVRRSTLDYLKETYGKEEVRFFKPLY